MKKDLSGKKFGRLTVLFYSHTDKNYRTFWSCICESGIATTIQDIRKIVN